MPGKPRLASRLLSLAVLVLVLAVGAVFDVVLARELLKRQQTWAVHHPAMDTRMKRPGDDVAPPLPKRAPYHHPQRAPLTASNSAIAGYVLFAPT